MNIHDVYGVYL